MLPRRGCEVELRYDPVCSPGSREPSCFQVEVVVHASTDDAPAVVDAATDMTTTEPEDLGARLGANLAARPVLSLKAPAPTRRRPRRRPRRARRRRTAASSPNSSRWRRRIRCRLPRAAAAACSPLPLHLLLRLPPLPPPPRRREGERGRARCRPAPARGALRRRSPPPARALLTPELVPLPGIAPRLHPAREDGAGFDDVSPYGSERRPPPGRPLGAFQPGHDTVGRRINDGRVAPVNTHANWKRAAPPPGDSAAHYGGERGIQGDMALPPPPLHVPAEPGHGGRRASEDRVARSREDGELGRRTIQRLVREDSMSLVSANSNDNFDEPSQEESSQPPRGSPNRVASRPPAGVSYDAVDV